MGCSCVAAVLLAAGLADLAGARPAASVASAKLSHKLGHHERGTDWARPELASEAEARGLQSAFGSASVLLGIRLR